MQVSVNDLLSGASLLLAVVSVLFGLWYAEIQKTIDTKNIPAHLEDRNPVIKEIAATLSTKSIPLSLASLLVAMVFLPNSVLLIIKAIETIEQGGLVAALFQYNAVEAAFIAVELLAVALAIHTSTLLYKLGKLLKKVKSKTML